MTAAAAKRARTTEPEPRPRFSLSMCLVWASVVIFGCSFWLGVAELIRWAVSR